MGVCHVQSSNIIVMPSRTPDRPSRLRREENPPFPEYDIAVLREVLKISETVGETAYAVNALESELKNHGEKLGAAIKTLEVASRKHGEMLEQVEGRVNSVRGILWFIGVLGAGIAIAAAIFELLNLH
jgi:hypothetical protein